MRICSQVYPVLVGSARIFDKESATPHIIFDCIQRAMIRDREGLERGCVRDASTPGYLLVAYLHCSDHIVM